MSAESKTYKCPLCPIVTETASALKCHAVSHTSERPFKCPHCDLSFSRSNNLNAHIRRLHSTPAELEALKKHKCDYCSYASDNKASLEFHIRRHTGQKQCTCPVPDCGRQFIGTHGLRSHLRIHWEARPFKCEYPGCDFQGKNQHGLTEHWAVHDNLRPFKCPVPECNYSAKLKSSLYKHSKIHKPPKYFCSYPGCDYKGHQRIHVRNHETIHSDLRPFKCPFQGCSYSAKTLSVILNHKKIHSTAVKPHACTFQDCDRRFLRHWELTAHKRSHTEEPYKCEFPSCDFKSWMKNNFKTHQATHNERTFPCAVSGCTYAGKSERHLKEHVKNHENPSYVSCSSPGCHFRSPNPKLMEKHMKLHESKYREHACPLCPRFYEREDTLEVHIRSHTGEKPYECLECSFCSAHIGGILGHMKRRHEKIISEKGYLREFHKKCKATKNKAKKVNSAGSSGQSVLSDASVTPDLDGSKTLACPLCHQMYAREEELEAHVRNHRGGRPFECPHCQFRCDGLGDIIAHVHQRHKKVYSFTDSQTSY